MTDLEMTKLCAEAMGYKPICPETGGTILRCGYFVDETAELYEPLENDAQAMALVKKFKLEIEREDSVNSRWIVNWNYRHDDLNRAIVECVAKQEKGNANTSI